MNEWQPIETVPLFRPVLVLGTWEGEINGPDKVQTRHLVTTENGKYFRVEGTDAYAAWVNNPTLWAEVPDLPVSSEGDK